MSEYAFDWNTSITFQSSITSKGSAGGAVKQWADITEGINVPASVHPKSGSGPSAIQTRDGITITHKVFCEPVAGVDPRNAQRIIHDGKILNVSTHRDANQRGALWCFECVEQRQ